MKPKILLRIAAFLIFSQCIGHTLYVITWTDTEDPIQKQVVKQMTDHKFPFGGTSRSAADYYNGFGYTITLAFLMIAVLLWIFSGAVAQPGKFTNRIIFTVALSLAAIGIVEVTYFFPFLVVLSLVAAGLSVLALTKLTMANRG